MSRGSRPDPEALLAATRSVPARGILRIYLGMCPGVGKTYTMLDEAARMNDPGVLAGFIESHGRAETAALADRIPSIPRKQVSYRGTLFEEFDIDEVLRLRPTLVLVDELAHTNVPGSRHPKRWQDLEELLSAGISVWTALNIQHVESLRDDVSSITGIRVNETVPDAFLDRADEIRVIDLTPDQLRARLAEGMVYLDERAGAAAEGFFREGNLRALREMALRFAARKVDQEKRDYMRRNLVEGPWRAGERFLVAVGPSPHAERLIRITARLAQQQNAGWIAVHIETGQALDDTLAAKLAANLSLADSLGGETLSLASEDPVRGILEVARRENVTQIVAGKNIRSGWWQRIWGSISDRLQSESGRIDLLLVHPGEGPQHAGADAQPFGAAAPILLHDILRILVLLAVITIVGFSVESWLGYRSVAMLYLVSVPLAGLALSRWGVLALALLGALAWNFFFTQPRLTLHMADHGDFVQLAAMMTVAVVIGQLTHRLRLREHASRVSEERARALYQLTRVTAASPTLAHGAHSALRQMEELFLARASLLVASGDGGELIVRGGEALDPKQMAVCRWALAHNEPAGKFTGTLPESEVLALPLAVNGRAGAILAVQPSDNRLASPVHRDLLETFATHLCVLIERDAYLSTHQQEALLEKTRHFQRALLDHISHEIKTPVAVIQGIVEQISSGATDRALLDDIREAAARLGRVMTQLASLSRADAGLIEPAYVVCDAHDLMKEVADQIPAGQVDLVCPDFCFVTDPVILETVLSNLLQNSFRHGTGRVRFEAAKRDGLIVFRITNPGPPISPECALHIFERFERGKGSQAGGLGLGLPIARSFSQLLGGEVTLARSDERETVFEARIPEQSQEFSNIP